MIPAARRDPWLLWLAQYVSACGDALFMPCLAWLAAGDGSAGAPLGLAVFVATAPHLIFGPLAGAWADRADRRRLMIASDLLRCALLVAVPFLAWAWGGLAFGALLGVGFLLAALSAPFLAARDALLPALVPPKALPRWNAFIQTSSHMALITGLALGGGLLVWLERSGLGEDEAQRVQWLLGLDGITFLVSALLLWGLRHRAAARVRGSRGAAWAETRAGLRYARKDPVVRGLLVLTALNNLAIMGPAIVGAALLVKGTFALGAEQYAFFELFMAAGMLVGGLFLARFAKRHHLALLILGGMVADGLTYVPFAWIPTYDESLVWITLHGLFIPCIVVGRTSLIQAYVPPDRHGRVFALVNLTVLGMTSVSALLCGVLADAVGPRGLFLGAGVFGALSGIAGWLWIGPRLKAAATTSA